MGHPADKVARGAIGTNAADARIAAAIAAINLPVLNAGVIPYTGTGANDRALAVVDKKSGAGFAPDLAFVFLAESRANDEKHLAFAWALGSAYGAIGENDAYSKEFARSRTNGDADNYWQGISGSDLILGANGSLMEGTNYNTWDYIALAVKFYS